MLQTKEKVSTRSMTAEEKRIYKQMFPNLDVNRALVSGEVTRDYNCIAWTVGITNRWLWPGDSLSAFERFYRSYGLGPASNGSVAAWGHNRESMTHGSTTGPGHGMYWESKCGEGLRIQHGLTELAGVHYGNVIQFYERRSLKEKALDELFSMIEDSRELGALNQEQLDFLHQECKKISPAARERFEKAYSAWKSTWQQPMIAFSSNPKARTANAEFRDLISLGHEILPLLMEKLTNPDDFFALQAVEKIASNEVVVLFEPDEDSVLLGEQGRALATLKRWLALQ